MNNAEAENLEALQVTLQQNPDSLTFARVADALMKMGRLDDAIQICEEGVKRHPHYVTGHMVLGKCYMQKKLYEQAEKEFKRVLLFDPKYIAAHRYYGDLMREIGWENTCEMSYRKILHIDPLDDKVRQSVDDFARKAQAAKPAAPAPPPPPPPAKEAPKTPPANASTSASKRIPLDVDNLFADSDLALPPVPPPSPAKKNEPAPAARAEKRAPKIEKSAAPETKSPSLSKSDEARFSSILDDIFQDEASEEAQFYQRTDEGPSKHPPSPHADDDPDRYAWKKAPREPKHRPEEANERKSGSDADASSLRAAMPAPPPTATAHREVNFEEAFEEVPAPETSWPAKESNYHTPTESFTPEPERAAVAPAVQELADPATRPPVLPAEGGARDRIVTPTLGEIYAAQGQYAKAIGVFELLSKKDPANRHFREKIDYLKKRLQETQNAG